MCSKTLNIFARLRENRFSSLPMEAHEHGDMHVEEAESVRAKTFRQGPSAAEAAEHEFSHLPIRRSAHRVALETKRTDDKMILVKSVVPASSLDFCLKPAMQEQG